jgi:hypothetical protein
LRSRGRMLGLISTENNQLGPWSTPWSEASSPIHAGGAPSCSAINRRWGPGHTVRGSSLSTVPHRNPKTRSDHGRRWSGGKHHHRLHHRGRHCDSSTDALLHRPVDGELLHHWAGWSVPLPLSSPLSLFLSLPLWISKLFIIPDASQHPLIYTSWSILANS